MLVLEEEVLPTADFLQFMAQCLEVIVKDSSLVGVSAWNDNGQCGIVFITAVKHLEYFSTINVQFSFWAARCYVLLC